MVPWSALLLPAALSAVLVFIASSLIHMVIRWHKSEYRTFPNEDPLGKYVELGWSESGDRRGGTIVGVVADVKASGLNEEVDPTIYLPFDQAPRSGLAVAVKTAHEKIEIAPALRYSNASGIRIP